MTSSRKPSIERHEPRGIRIAAVLAVAAGVAFVVWYFAIRDAGDGGGGSAPKRLGPVAATEGDVSDLAKKDNHPIYWAGEQPGTSKLELTQTADGNVYVRYLSGDATIGTPKPSYLTVGTYPFNHPMHALRVIAKRSGAVTKEVSNGGFAVTNTNSPTSVYLAYPKADFQIEVYDPDPAKALDLVTSGQIEPVR